MKYIKYTVFTLLFVPLLSIASTDKVVLPSAGLTPESSFYFLDRIGESMQELFTFNIEAKIKLQIKFAEERISEIKVLVEKDGVHIKGINKAKSLLLANVAYASEILNNETSLGNDVTVLSEDIDNQFKVREELLTQTFLDARKKLVGQHIKIRTKLLADAKKTGDLGKIALYTEQLNEIKNKAKGLEEIKNEIKKSINEINKSKNEANQESDQQAEEDSFDEELNKSDHESDKDELDNESENDDQDELDNESENDDQDELDNESENDDQDELDNESENDDQDELDNESHDSNDENKDNNSSNNNKRSDEGQREDSDE